MRKGMWSAAAALVALLSGAGVVLGGPPVLAADGRVAMVEPSQSDALKWAFDPADVTISAGSTVVWHNDGKQVHTVTADDGAFDSGNVSPGGDFQWEASAPGDFAYKCKPHPWMKGVVHVVGGAAPAPAAPTPAPQPAATPTTAPAQAPQSRTAGAQAPTTTSTTRGAAAASTPTTAAPVTTTTLASAVTPTSAPDTAGVTATTPGPAGGEEVAGGPPEGGSSHGHKESNVVGIALAGMLTLGLGGISAKLLAAKP